MMIVVYVALMPTIAFAWKVEIHTSWFKIDMEKKLLINVGN